MQAQKKLTELNWGWISGMALGLGSAVGVAWGSWSAFVIVTLIVAALMVAWAQRVR